ncbi:hypothetical protein [Bacteroides sp.]|uniref:hypothetical protein n=1 Tax=Bacteroides sp. TaxID=29523 RepID=UPI003D0F8C10
MEQLIKLSGQELVELCLKLQGQLEEAEKSKKTLYEMYELERKKLENFRDAVKSVVTLVD